MAILKKEQIKYWGMLAIPLPLFIALLYAVPRTQSSLVIGIFSFLFLWYWLLSRHFKKIPLRWIITTGILLRVLAVPGIPSLSDDYFRFLWDGQLLIHGENPFNRIPADIHPSEYEALGLSSSLFDGLNSPEYFTIYPPINQALFALAATMGDNIVHGVWTLKASLLLAEIINLFLLFSLLRIWKKPLWWLGFYALNPLIIIELVGNIHFEAWMLCGLLGSLYLLEKKRWVIASLAFGFAIASKLLPIMFFPLLIKRLGWVKSIAFGAIASSLTLLGFALLPKPETVLNIASSVGLYFKTFEFNAGIYQWLKFAGLSGELLGKALAVLSMLGIGWISLSRKKANIQNLAVDMLFVLTLYFFCSRIVHPWYICTLAGLASLSQLRYPFIWTSLLPITYLTYTTKLYHQPYALMAACYVLLIGFMVYEWRKINASSLSTSSE